MLILVASNKRLVEAGNSYVELLYTPDQSAWANGLAKELAQFQLRTTERALTSTVCIRGFAGQMN